MDLTTFKRLAVLAPLTVVPFATAATAAPLSMPRSGDEATLAQPVACWWRGGVRVCDRARYGYQRNYGYGRYYGYGPSYGYGTARPEQLPFGSTEWWRAMDREGRGGYRR